MAALSQRLVEQMLHTRYQLYVHEATGTRIVRCAAYSIPANLSTILAHVGPTLHMVDVATIRGADGSVSTAAQMLRNYDDTRMRTEMAGQQMRDASAAARSPDATPSCTPYVDLPCLDWLYSRNGAYGSVPSNGVAATGYHQEYIASEDIHDFLAWFDPAWLSDDVTVIGPNDQTNPGGEATMDVQLIMGIPAYFLSTGGSEPHGPSADEPFLAFLTALLDMSAPPLADNELDLDVAYLNQVNTKFQMAGVMGISLLFASGDGGVAGGYAVPNCTDFIAVFPHHGAHSGLTRKEGSQIVDPRGRLAIIAGGSPEHQSIESIASHARTKQIVALDRTPSGGATTHALNRLKLHTTQRPTTSEHRDCAARGGCAISTRNGSSGWSSSRHRS